MKATSAAAADLCLQTHSFQPVALR